MNKTYFFILIKIVPLKIIFEYVKSDLLQIENESWKKIYVKIQYKIRHTIK